MADKIVATRMAETNRVTLRLYWTFAILLRGNLSGWGWRNRAAQAVGAPPAHTKLPRDENLQPRRSSPGPPPPCGKIPDGTWRRPASIPAGGGAHRRR